MNKQTACVGLDFGTTNSVAAVMEDHGKPVVLINAEGNPLTRTSLFYEKGSFLIGAPADSAAALNPEAYIPDLKRRIGQDPDGILFKAPGTGEEFNGAKLTGIFLSHMKGQIETQLGDKDRKYVLTVPARFEQKQRECVLKGAELAGMDVVGIINEPTAAALAYGLSESRSGQTLVVLDVGGGTFDCTVAQIDAGQVQVIGSGGIPTGCAGRDLDELIFQEVQKAFRDSHGFELAPETDAPQILDTRDRGEGLKKALSFRQESFLIATARGVEERYTLTRAGFEALIADKLEAIVSETERLLASVSVSWKDVTGVVYVGGSTRIPALRQRFEERARLQNPKIKVFGDIDPDRCVAIGAAYRCAMEVAKAGDTIVSPSGKAIAPPRAKMTDVACATIGVATTNGGDDGAEFLSPIIRENERIPASREEVFSTIDDNQTEAEIRVLQGAADEKAERANVLYTLVLQISPPSPKGAKRIAVRFEYDADGLCTVKVRDTMGSNEVSGKFTHAQGVSKVV